MKILVYSEKTKQTALLVNPDIILNANSKEIIFRTYHTFVSVSQTQLSDFNIDLNEYYDHIVSMSADTSAENGDFINAIPSIDMVVDIDMSRMSNNQ